MVYRLAYCEDNSEVGHLFSQKIIAAFQKRGLRASVSFFTSPLTLEESILSGELYDALILDVDMPELNGIALTARLQKLGFGNTVVFLSNREDMVYRSLQVRPVRFVRKSHFASEIGECVTALLRQIEKDRTECVLLQAGKDTYRFFIRDLIYMEIANQTLTVHTRSDSVQMKYRLNDAERQLSAYGFLRIHKSYLVNYRYIFSIQRDRVVLSGGTELPLSRHRYAEITAALLEWTKRELRKGADGAC